VDDELATKKHGGRVHRGVKRTQRGPVVAHPTFVLRQPTTTVQTTRPKPTSSLLLPLLLLLLLLLPRMCVVYMMFCPGQRRHCIMLSKQS
jgi:hypothetical protein